MMIRKICGHDSLFRHTTSNTMFKIDEIISVLIFLIIFLVNDWIRISDIEVHTELI